MSKEEVKKNQKKEEIVLGIDQGIKSLHKAPEKLEPQSNTGRKISCVCIYCGHRFKDYNSKQICSECGKINYWENQ